MRWVILAATSSGSRFIVDGVDVREDGRRSAPRDRLCRRVERERRTDDLVARCRLPSASSTSTSASVPLATPTESLYAEIVGRLALERGDVRPEDELAALEHAVDRLADARQERLVLSFDVNERDRTHGWKV